MTLWFIFPSKDNKKNSASSPNKSHIMHSLKYLWERTLSSPYNLGAKCLLSLPHCYQPQICELFIPNQTHASWIRKKQRKKCNNNTPPLPRTHKVTCFLLSHCLLCPGTSEMKLLKWQSPITSGLYISQGPQYFIII